MPSEEEVSKMVKFTNTVMLPSANYIEKVASR